MSRELLWKVGGAQGEGIDSCGEIFAQALNRLGYWVFGYRHFMSLIKGGHTYYKVRVSPDQTLRYHGDGLQILLAFDQYTIDYNAHELMDGAVVIFDSTRFEARLPSDRQIHGCAVPMAQMAKSLGGEIMKNIVAVGASAAVVGLSTADFASVIEGRFGGKLGGEIVAKNMEALRQGHAYCQEHFLATIGAGERARFAIPPLELPGDPQTGIPVALRRSYASGNDLTAMGALVAGCRFLAAYPITPATEIMYWLLRHLPEVGGAVVQAEDEIAALNMAIGAGYAGVRAMTSSSGPGLSLMSEALGFAGIAEVPVVIVDVMRGGPATGLPTKTEQSDLNHLLYTAHGDSQRIVLAAMDVEDCFCIMGEAFNLAEHYQVPVVVATDLYLGMSRQSTAGLDFSRVLIDRGTVLSAEEQGQMEPGQYKRYRLTDSGISPRSIPGRKGGEYTALSNERNEEGREEAEDQYSRVTQHQKRARKLEALELAHRLRLSGDAHPDLLLVGWGSTGAQIAEAVEHLRSQGMRVGHLQVGALMPLPVAPIARALAAARQVLVVEQNLAGQFADLLQFRVPGCHEKMSRCLKYNGDPFTVGDIVGAARRVTAAAHPVALHVRSTGLGGAPESLEVK